MSVLSGWVVALRVVLEQIPPRGTGQGFHSCEVSKSTFIWGGELMGKMWKDRKKSFKGLGKIYYLTREIVDRWKAGGLDKTWLNFKLKVPYVIGVSGDYIYFIRVKNPREVSFKQVPAFYKRCVNPKKKIYEYDARLERIERRNWRRWSRCNQSWQALPACYVVSSPVGPVLSNHRCHKKKGYNELCKCYRCGVEK